MLSGNQSDGPPGTGPVPNPNLNHQGDLRYRLTFSPQSPFTDIPYSSALQTWSRSVTSLPKPICTSS